MAWFRTKRIETGGRKNPSDTERAEFELWKAKEELKVRREELELKRQELAKYVWSSPLVLAVVGLIATILGGMMQSYFQSSATTDLERRRFESALIQKALDTADVKEAVKRLKFCVDLGFVNDENGKIATYLEKPDEIPLQPTTSPSSDCAPNIVDITGCPDEGCGAQYDPTLNRRKNIRSNSQESTRRSIQWMKDLPDPKDFTRESINRDELAKIGEGQKVTLVAYALSVRKGSRESCNCGLIASKDTDNTIVLVDPGLPSPTLQASEQDSVTAEFTPRVRPQHPNYTQEKLEPLIDPEWRPGTRPSQGKLLVRVTGVLLFDSEHFLQHSLKRHNNWEIHPILKLEYCPDGQTCEGESDANWKDLDFDQGK